MHSEDTCMEYKCATFAVEDERRGLTRGEKVVKRTRHVCTTTFWRRRFPILSFIRHYNASFLLSDVIAGVTVGLTFIPTAMASSLVAGLPTKHGLYTTFMSYFVYTILGSRREVNIGPNIVTALFCKPLVDKYGPDIAFTFCFYTGAMVTLIGVLNLGFMLDFISSPVMDGFLSAAAISAGAGQVPALLGFKRSGSNFLHFAINIICNSHDAKLWDTVLGLSCIAALVLITFLGKYVSTSSPEGKTLPSHTKLLRCIVKYVTLAKTAIVVIISTAIVANVAGEPPVRIAGVKLIQAFLNSNYRPSQQTNGETIDTTQEMIAVGISNLMGSFVQAFPSTGSVVRTMINKASGVKTPLGGTFAGIMVLLSLCFFTNALKYFPTSTLAAIVICALPPLIRIHKCSAIFWKSKKSDLLPLHATFWGCLLGGLDVGMVAGILSNIVILLYDAARPKLSIKTIQVCGHSVLLVRPDRGVTYAAAEHVKHRVTKSSARSSSLVIVLDGTHVHALDTTAVKVLLSLIREVEMRQQQMYLWQWRRAAVNTFITYDKTIEKYLRSDDTLEQLVQFCCGSEDNEDDEIDHNLNFNSVVTMTTKQTTSL